MDDLLRKSGLLFVAPIIAYLIGWQYMSEWSKFFGVNLTALGVPIEYYFVQGFGVIYGGVTGLKWMALAFVAALAAYIGIWSSQRFVAVRLGVSLAAVVVMMVLGFLVAGKAGRADALGLAKGQFGRRVDFVFSDDFVSRGFAPEILTANEHDGLGVVWQGQTAWIVVNQTRIRTLGSAGGDASKYTYVISDREIVAARTGDENRLMQSLEEQ